MSQDNDLKELEERIKTAKQGELYRKAVKPEDKEGKATGAYQAVVELMAGIGVGGFLGYHADKFLATSPLFFIVCLILGFGGGVLNIIKRNK